VINAERVTYVDVCSSYRALLQKLFQTIKNRPLHVSWLEVMQLSPSRVVWLTVYTFQFESSTALSKFSNQWCVTIGNSLYYEWNWLKAIYILSLLLNST